MTRKEVVELCREGDRQALDWLYKTYADRMRKICLHYVADWQIAQDLLHDGFIIIFSSIHTLRLPDMLEVWMGTIMRNLSLQYVRQRGLSAPVSLEEISEDDQPAESDEADVFPTYAEMLNLIEKLPEGYGRIFRLSVLEGLSHKEIGLLLHIAPHSSSSQLARAKKMLRRLISQYRVRGLVLLLSAISVCVYRYQLYRTGDEACTRVRVDGDREEMPGTAPPPSSPVAGMVGTDGRRTAVSLRRRPESVAHMAVGPDVTRPDSTVLAVDNGLPPEEEQDEKPHSGAVRKHYGALSFPMLPGEARSAWALSFAYSGGANRTHVRASKIPGSITSGEPGQVTYVSHHHSPVAFSLLARKRINERWGVETGVQYTFLRTDFTSVSKVRTERVQRLHYVGIPIRGTFHVWGKGRGSIYASAGVSLDIPVKATAEEALSVDGLTVKQERYGLKPSWQWSVSVGVGFQYAITPTVGLFAEPNLYYYFNPGDGIRTVRTDRPFRVVLPVGLRFSW